VCVEDSAPCVWRTVHCVRPHVWRTVHCVCGGQCTVCVEDSALCEAACVEDSALCVWRTVHCVRPHVWRTVMCNHTRGRTHCPFFARARKAQHVT